MKHTEHNAKPATTPKTGIFATLRALFHIQGTSAPKISRGSGAPSRTPLLATLAAIAATLLASAGLTAALPATASAYATIEGPPVFSTAPGLPDSRVYELVSPIDKDGNEAGASSSAYITGAVGHYGLAAADGDSVLFEGTGPMGESPSPDSLDFVASKNESATGWSTRALAPGPLQKVELLESKLGILPSADLTHVMFEPLKPLSAYGGAPTDVPCELKHGLYLSGSDPFAPATWLGRAETGECSEVQGGSAVGGTPDFSTVYFTNPGTLLPEDASRVPHARPREIGGTERSEAWGLYEDREGVLREAGALPDGVPDEFGAVPATGPAGNEVSSQASPSGAPAGSRVFFVSPDPASCEQNGGRNDCAADPPELYVRENGERTALVSRDTLLPAAGAPSGVLYMPIGDEHADNVSNPLEPGRYVFASPDGSQAFFQSADKLTSSAPPVQPSTYHIGISTTYTGLQIRNGESEPLTGTFTLTAGVNGSRQTTAPIAPNATAPTVQSALEALSNVGAGNVTVSGGPVGSESTTFTVKFAVLDPDAEVQMEIGGGALEPSGHVSVLVEDQTAADGTYDFNVPTGELTYLPGVVGEILATDPDGSAIAFVNTATDPAELELWSAGSSGDAGGTVTAITQLPETADVYDARMSSDGSALVFVTRSSLSSHFNSGGDEQIYRFDSATNTLGCVSCAPAGVTPSGSASMSSRRADESYEVYEPAIPGTVEPRGISANGDRIFFDTPDPLVPQDTDTNTPSVLENENEYQKQGRDVYEWENGVVYLISGGEGARNSLYLDSSENGDDVFFTTTEGLTPGDTDGGYDVYDARVPQPGDNPPAAAVPCEGSVCQGPPNVPSPLTPPASATFSGLGNPAPEPATAAAKTVTKKAAKCKKGFTKKKSTCVKSKKTKKARKSATKGRK